MLLIPIAFNTCDGLGEEDVHAEPAEIAISGIELIIDCPFREGKVIFKFPERRFSRFPLIITFPIFDFISSKSKFHNFKIFLDSSIINLFAIEQAFPNPTISGVGIVPGLIFISWFPPYIIGFILLKQLFFI